MAAKNKKAVPSSSMAWVIGVPFSFPWLSPNFHNCESLYFIRGSLLARKILKYEVISLSWAAFFSADKQEVETKTKVAGLGHEARSDRGGLKFKQKNIPKAGEVQPSISQSGLLKIAPLGKGASQSNTFRKHSLQPRSEIHKSLYHIKVSEKSLNKETHLDLINQQCPKLIDPRSLFMFHGSHVRIPRN